MQEEHDEPNLQWMKRIQTEYPHWGIRGLGYMVYEHRELEEIVRQVIEEEGLQGLPQVLVHKGSLFGTAYFHDYDSIVVSEKSLDILTHEEFRALMHHEFDHYKKARNIMLMDEAADSLKSKGADKVDSLTKSMRRFRDYLEFSADKAAAEYEGAEVMASALKKVMIAGIEDIPKIRDLYFPELHPEVKKMLTHEQIEARVDELAAGTYKPIGWQARQTAARFERLRKMAASGGAVSPDEL